MKNNYYLMIVMCSSLMVVSCSDSSSSNAANDATDPPVEEIEEPVVVVPNELGVIGSLSADDEPAALSAQLDSDVSAVFGGADGAATDVVAGDTIITVIDRADAL